MSDQEIKPFSLREQVIKFGEDWGWDSSKWLVQVEIPSDQAWWDERAGKGCYYQVAGGIGSEAYETLTMDYLAWMEGQFALRDPDYYQSMRDVYEASKTMMLVDDGNQIIDLGIIRTGPDKFETKYLNRADIVSLLTEGQDV